MPVPDYADATPAYKQIAGDIRGRIKSGEYAPGDRLPSNRALSERYSVAPETIRAALDELRGEGLVAAQSTRGTFVVSVPGETGEETVKRLASTLEGALERLSDFEERLAAAEKILRGDGQ
jgi:DNA-binding GntR family transcriptional regulator